MYKNFILTEAEKAEILNNHKEAGYKQPINENEDWTNVRKGIFGDDVDSAPHIKDLNDIESEFKMHLQKEPDMSFDQFVEYFDKIDELVDEYGHHMEDEGMDMHDEANLEKFYEIRDAGEHYKEKISQEYEGNKQEPLNEGKKELIKTFNKFFK
jgi:hypothetical protein